MIIDNRDVKGECIEKLRGCPMQGNFGACCESSVIQVKAETNPKFFLLMEVLLEC
jgi:hypothetical protein